MKLWWGVVLAAGALLLLGVWWVGRNQDSQVALVPSTEYVKPPLADATESSPHVGVTRWQRRDSDGTTLDLFRIDFAKNPRLKLELYDQDEDDETPLDDRVHYWQRGIYPVAQKLQRKVAEQDRKLIAVWNGSYFGLKNLKPREKDFAFHVSPVVVGGKVLYNTSNHRWTWGLQMQNGKPHFKVLHLPGRALLEHEFDFATGATQCLLLDGQPLKIEPYPAAGEKAKQQPVPSTPEEAGHIPILDHMKTSRLSVAWPRDSQQLWLLLVKEPDGEKPSREAVEKRRPDTGGWMLADVQKFWMGIRNHGIASAVALDGGDVAQLALRKDESTFEFVSPRMAIEDLEKDATQRVELNLKEQESVPEQVRQGGSLMYFYLSEGNAK